MLPIAAARSIKSLCFTAALVGVFLATNSVAAAAVIANDSDSDKVQVELYYESQCPGCREMITTSFYEAFQAPGFLDMADITFVPYGNAQETGTTASGFYEFECQHGESECIFNVIETCALAKISDDDPLLQFKYIDCIEHNDESRDPTQDYYKVAIACAELAGLKDDVVSDMQDCATGMEGNQLEHEMAVKTDSLNPPHTYVPYVVVNGDHNDDIQNAVTDSLFNYVCNAYTGSDKSPACPAAAEQHGDNNNSVNTDDGVHYHHYETELCYRDDHIITTMDTVSVAEE